MEKVLGSTKDGMGGFMFLLDSLSFQKDSAGKKKYFPNDVFTRELMEYLDSYNYDIDRPKKLQKKEVIGITHDFFDKHFKLYDIYIKEKNTLYIGNPFEIKVKPVDGIDAGELGINYDYYNKVCFDCISLGKEYDYNSVGVYGHELTHTQIEREYRKFYYNFFYKEVLPIFMEKVVVYETNSKYFDSIKTMRLRMLKGTLDYYNEHVWNYKSVKADAFPHRCYIESTLIADHLFYKYANSDKAHQIKILSDIQKVFDGYISVDEFISIERVGLASSKSLKYIK